MIKVIEGDLLKTSASMIIHQVNAVPVMGSGVAKQIANLYPEVEKKYIEFINTNKPFGREFVMGKSINVPVNNPYTGYRQSICNVVGQYDIGMGQQNTEYRFLFEGILSVLREADFAGSNVALPWKMGCFRGGGDWDGVVYPFLDLVSRSFKQDILIYKLDRN